LCPFWYQSSGKKRIRKCPKRTINQDLKKKKSKVKKIDPLRKSGKAEVQYIESRIKKGITIFRYLKEIVMKCPLCSLVK